MAKAAYQRIHDEILHQILSDEYAVGDLLPSEQQLEEKFNVSRITVKTAMNMLANDGYIIRKPGKGTFLLDKNPEKDTAPSAAACASTSIGFIVSSLGGSFGLDILRGIESRARSKKCNLLLKLSEHDLDNEIENIRVLQEQNVDGLIISPVHNEIYNEEILRMVVDKYPHVIIDRSLPGLSSVFVGTDNQSAAYQLTRYLTQRGHREICFVSTHVSEASSLTQRFNGFSRALAECGTSFHEDRHFLAIESIKQPIPLAADEEYFVKDCALVQQQIKRFPEITAFFSSSYYGALLIKKALLDIGKFVPDDYSIVCFDSPYSFTGTYEFTHMKQREYDIGTAAVDLLLKQIRGESAQTINVFEAELVEADSVRTLESSV